MLLNMGSVFNLDDDINANIDRTIVSIIRESVDLNRVVEQLMAAIEASCDGTLMKAVSGGNGGQQASVCWWNKELTTLRRQVNQKRRQYQRTFKDDNLRKARKQEYYNFKSDYKSKINRAKIDSWKKFCNSTDKTQPWNCVYKMAAGKLKARTICAALQRADGSFTNTLE